MRSSSYLELFSCHEKEKKIIAIAITTVFFMALIAVPLTTVIVITIVIVWRNCKKTLPRFCLMQILPPAFVAPHRLGLERAASPTLRTR